MKKILQIVQKCIFPSVIVVLGILFIYGLIFATPVRTLVLFVLETGGNIAGANPDKGIVGSSTILNFLEKFPDALTIVRQTNSFSNTCLVLSVVGLVITGICFLLRSNIRNKYYWTNFICVGSLGAYLAVISGYCLFFITRYVFILNRMDLVALNEKIPSFYHYPPVEGFGFFHILGYIITFAMLILSLIIFVFFVYKIIYRIVKHFVKAR